MIGVTGASGHLGQWVVSRLTEMGMDVICLSRRPLEHPTVRGLVWRRPVRTLPCDLSNPSDLASAARALTQAEGIVHLAAHIPGDTARNSDQDFRETLRANALATALLLHSLRDAPKLKAVVYASTFEVYGPPVALPVAEDHPTLPTSYYGAGKLTGEKYLALFAKDRGVACCSLRMPAIYGPGDTTRRAIGNFIRAAAEGRDLLIHGDGSDRRDLVYVADAAEAIALALERRAGGALNAGGGAAFSIQEMAETVIRVSGTAARIDRHERVKPRVDYALDISRARAALGWEPRTPLEEGIRAQLEWLGSQKGPAS